MSQDTFTTVKITFTVGQINQNNKHSQYSTAFFFQNYIHICSKNSTVTFIFTATNILNVKYRNDITPQCLYTI